MAVYRVYRVYDDERLEPGESFYCETDAEALSKLRPATRADVRTELWQGGRFIAAASTSHGMVFPQPLRPGPMPARPHPAPAGGRLRVP
jgi:hypothetical protein